jgi:hypothetical protein
MLSKPSDFVPREYHDRQVTALTDRCVAAENALADLLIMLDPEVLVRHGYDWAAAVKELLA